MTTQSQKLFAITIFGYKREDMSKAEYHEYISKTHAGHLKALLAKNDIVSYTMQHNTTESASLIDKVYGGQLPASAVSDVDAIIQIVFKDIDDYLRVREDDHFKKVVNPDHKNFANAAKTRMSVGEFEVHVRDGEVVS
ncbi:hypothetical protein K491DRAFT_657861 [Lophiostoma macrostomum CBS 122681]|uniref:EthD domain-containing protein n=1 Tax=Lophiostoma macrostomum CBS 122681 TaxID=1314788 RepID=A0A6A6T7B4_9PLEO|nr:hypothetical protein K491DRAFT_657861 [Lophiostoma macrostomum CBS 122681]